MKSTKEKFLTRVDRFMRRYKMSASRVGSEAVRDPSFIQRLREPRIGRKEPNALTTDMMDKVNAFMRDFAAKAKKAMDHPGKNKR